MTAAMVAKYRPAMPIMTLVRAVPAVPACLLCMPWGRTWPSCTGNPHLTVCHAQHVAQHAACSLTLSAPASMALSLLDLTLPYRFPFVPLPQQVVPYLKRDGLKWKLEGRHAARQALLTSGLLPTLAAPTPSGALFMRLPGV